MQARKNNFWKEYGAPFFLCFALAGAVFVTARAFMNAPPKFPAIAIILSPHFDDAALSLGGLMAETKEPAVVATFFAGEPPTAEKRWWDSLSGFSSSDEAMAARRAENIKALAETGAHPLDLPFLDFQYRDSRDAAYRQRLLNSARADIETILKTFAGAENISVYGPAEFGSAITHPDHQILHDAFTAAARRNVTPHIHFYYFEDFPYIRLFGMSATTSLAAFLEARNGGVFLRETPLPLDSAALNKKIKAIDAYASQEKAFKYRGGESLSALAKTFAENRCKKSEPAWHACEVVYEISRIR